VAAIVAGGLLGWRTLSPAAVPPGGGIGIRLPRGLAVAALVAFFALLGGLPALAIASHSHALALVDRFYRAGSLVFGGGHVVLPLLQQAVVPPGWIGPDAFLAGYGAAQAVPGPLFTFAAYLGAAMHPGPSGVAGGLLCLAAIYLPSFLLLIGVLPFWEGLRRRAGVRAALGGVNATVVGLLLAALYTPVWTSAIAAPRDFALGLVAFLALTFWRVPPWLVVLLGGAASAALGSLHGA
jgi:chromate transporter